MRRSRRAFLRAAALAGALGVAGCHEEGDGTPTQASGGGDGADGGTPTATSTGTATPTEGPTDSPTASETASPTESETPTETETETETETPTEAYEVTEERWDQFGFDAANVGAAPERGNVAGEGVRWSVPFDERTRAQPAFDEQRVLVPTDEAVYGISRADGSVLWRHEVAESAPATPAIADDFCYVVTGERLAKVNMEEGWSAWSVRYDDEFPRPLVSESHSPPTLYNGTVLVNVAAERRNGTPSTVNHVLSVNAEDGTVQGVFVTDRKTNLPPSDYVGAPAVLNGNAYITAGRNTEQIQATLYRVGVGGGGTVLEDYEGWGWYSVTAHEGNLYFADEFLHSYTPGGTRRFKRRVLPRPRSLGVAAVGNRVIATSERFEGDTGTVYGFELTYGRALWQFEGGDKMYIPAATSETVLVGDSTGTMYALSPDDGTLQGELSLQQGSDVFVTTPVIGSETVYVVSSVDNDSSTLHAISV